MFDIDPAFRPRAGIPPPLTRSDDVATLLTVAARSRDPWPLCFIGAALARIYARAACVVAPPGGLEAIEAAASGARIIVARGSVAADVAAELCEPFEAGDPSSLAGAIARARHAPRDHEAAARIVWRHARLQAAT